VREVASTLDGRACFCAPLLLEGLDGDQGIETRARGVRGRRRRPSPTGDPTTSRVRPVDPAPTYGWEAGGLGGVSGRTIDADRGSGLLRGVQDGRGTVRPQTGASPPRGGQEPPCRRGLGGGAARAAPTPGSAGMAGLARGRAAGTTAPGRRAGRTWRSPSRAPSVTCACGGTAWRCRAPLRGAGRPIAARLRPRPFTTPVPGSPSWPRRPAGSASPPPCQRPSLRHACARA
jgi:hypothetical protein